MAHKASVTRRIVAFLLAAIMTALLPLSMGSCSERKKHAVVVELYPEMAPITVENFERLVSDGFYVGTTFHRVVAGFMIQGGDPTGSGIGNSPYGTIKGEFSSNGVSYNTLRHEKGTISMARSNSKDSASCQFFICVAKQPSLDGNYAAFGKTVYGMDYVMKLSKIETNDESPVKGIIIEEANLLSPKEAKKQYGVRAKNDNHNFVEFIIRTIDPNA